MRRMKRIDLYEMDDGKLIITDGHRAYDVTSDIPAGCFEAAAAEFADRLNDEWTVPEVASFHLTGLNLVACWYQNDGQVCLFDHPSKAAMRYIKGPCVGVYATYKPHVRP